MLRALQNQRRRSADAGFTLIELLIVIVILGVLAAIVVFSVSKIVPKSETAACQSVVAEVDTAYEAYVADGHGSATTAGTALSALAPYFHNGDTPSEAGSANPLTPASTVAAVDGITC
ncbi:type II secretion system protein [Nocardioides ultimimeridianus]